MENVPIKIESFGSEYSEQGLKEKLSKIARKAGIKMAYAVLVAFYAVQSDALSFKEKARLYGALGYFILPVDLIPDAILGMGYSDDLAALVYVLHTVSSNITPEVKQRAREKLCLWFDNVDIDIDF
ncbi:MAG: DUF1232 domain-containing protein [Prevotella sp.]|nr:DUF1232 domain-containing protein [Prevotella sp.]